MSVRLQGALRRTLEQTGSREEQDTETRITRHSITLITHCYQCGQLKKEEMGGTRNTHDRIEKFIYVLPKKPEGKKNVDARGAKNSGIF